MVYIFLANGFEEIEALFPLDLLRRAGIDVTTVAVGNSKTVTGAHGISVVADITESELDKSAFEAVILPGGMPGTTNLDCSDIVQSTIKVAIDMDKLVCAICAAPSILGKNGYLRDKKATCFPGFEQYLDGAIFSDERVVRDGNFITSKGMGCAAEFGLAIIDALSGTEKSNEIEKSAFIK